MFRSAWGAGGLDNPLKRRPTTHIVIGVKGTHVQSCTHVHHNNTCSFRLAMSSTPIIYRRLRSRKQSTIQSPLLNLKCKLFQKDDLDPGESDSDSASGYSTPIGKLMPCVNPSQVLSRLCVPQQNECALDGSVYTRENSKSDVAEVRNKERTCAVSCDVTCHGKAFSGDLCDCSLRWTSAVHQAVETASTGTARRIVYERAERVAGRDPDPKMCSRLERGEPLYPNCDMSIWLRSCDIESVVPVQGQVYGIIPLWIRGTLLRNGPGRLKFGEEEFAHLFDCSALVQRYAIFDGTATYQSRYLRTDTFLRNSAAQRIVVSEFGTRACPDPCQSIFKRVAAIFTPGEVLSDNANISVYPFGDEFYAFTESTIVTRFDPVTLHTIERVNLANYVGIINHSAHPIIFPDGATSLGTALGASGPRYTLIHFPTKRTKAEDTKNSKEQTSRLDNGAHEMEDSDRPLAFLDGRIVASVRARWPLHPAYMHTFGVTDNFFVLVEQPMSVSVTKVMHNHLEGDSIGTAMRWFPEYPTLIHLIERATGHHSHTFHTSTLFFLHVINAFERENGVVIDICCYENPEMINCMYVDALRAGQQNPDFARMFRGRPLRFEMPLKGDIANAASTASPGTAYIRTAMTVRQDPSFIKPNQLSDLGCETPRVPQHLVGKAYRYFYAISSDVDLENPGTLIKVDTFTKRSWRWAEEGVYPSEPIYVPRPSSQAEDDGVILSALTWSSDDRRTALLVLDAPTWTEVGRVEFTAQGVVPKCLHGWFSSNVV